MERIVNLLVEYDKAGQALVDEARQQHAHEMEQLDEQKARMREDYEQRCSHRLVTFRQEAEQEKNERLAAARRTHEQQMDALRKRFEENREAWVLKIVRNCVGG